MKRLGLAAILAVAIHAGLFWVELPLAKPMLPAASNKAVSISLVTVRKTVVSPRPPMAAPKPSSPPAPKPKKRPKPKPKLKPQEPTPPIPKALPRIKPYVTHVPELAAIEPLAPMAEVVETPPLAMEASSSEADAAPSPMTSPEASTTSADANSASVTVAVPMYKTNPLHEYPPLARRRQYEGTVLLDVLVDRNGRVVELKVARSSGFRILDRSALEDVKQWRFEPARRGGRPFEMRVKVPVRYELK